MSARDAGTLFKEIYRFVQNDEGFDNASYGNLMKNAMLQGNHTVIIPAGVSPSRAMHKYGWDTNAYHDAAAIREILGLRPIREFDLWLEKMGISENGRLTSRAGDPTIFLNRKGRG